MLALCASYARTDTKTHSFLCAIAQRRWAIYLLLVGAAGVTTGGAMGTADDLFLGTGGRNLRYVMNSPAAARENQVIAYTTCVTGGTDCSK